jgi:single-strand DNA-binding protein
MKYFIRSPAITVIRVLSYAVLVSGQSQQLIEFQLRPAPARLSARDGNLDRREATSRSHFMNSFTLTAVGNLAKDPELAVKGGTTHAHICLVGNDYAGKDSDGNAREAATSLYFVAFDGLGEAIAKNARKGDQLIVQAQVRANTWIDKDGEKRYDHSFVIQGFRFGAPGRAKREELAARRGENEMDALETEI